jgi:hypothetical protein
MFLGKAKITEISKNHCSHKVFLNSLVLLFTNKVHGKEINHERTIGGGDFGKKHLG